MAATTTPDEATRIHTNYASYSGKAESQATLAESADGCSREDGDDGRAGGAEGEGRAHKGLSAGLAALFLLAEMAGAGILNLPRAVANTGWGGLPLMVVLALAVGFAGTRLGMCWVLLEDRWPQYRTPCRRPYPAIARRALGIPGQVVAEASVLFTLFGASTVYLLLAVQMTHSLLSHYVPTLSPCAWCLILGVLLCPTTWFSTPKDFWGAPVLALGATLLACLVVLSEVVVQRDTHEPPLFPSPTFHSVFLGFGAILFALGGASLFPTIQNDMKDRSQFPHSVILTFLVLLAVYLPFSSICYGLLGDNGVPDNILQAVSGPAVTVTQSFILCHFLFAFSVVINPINQALEGAFKMSNDFGVRRVAMRTCTMVVVVLVGFTIPDFSKILDLIGGSTVTLMSFVLPPLCYLRLNASSELDGQPHRVLPMWEVVVLWVIVVLGVMGGVASTWSALSAIIDGQSFNSTCFSPHTFCA
ncbi:uncharacterized protein LOC127008522 [Eriocheir sinensis]|uniref:uncharacterized protein LOC127008522 n=1 Tax=Eriocheir sinensis TaxID=95602 RepID=UPI0021C59BDC|nr:uncharacterized protein LOC127008522 [Eriocheir sinensis]XP_050736647.1 uncharacterized protein LOC127008522 [Eriocheir sinensis]